MNETTDSDFIDPQCNRWTLDYFYARRAILNKIILELPNLQGVLLDVGCGISPYKSILVSTGSRVSKYLGLDLADNIYGVTPDLSWDGKTIPLDAGSVDSVLATEVLEHCFDPARPLRESFRVLRSGGFILATVPFLWPLHDSPYDEYRYTPFSLKRHFEESGFHQVEVRATGGWNASLAQMLGLWVRRRPMNEFQRRLLQALLLPVYRWLLRHDKIPADLSHCTDMITGLTVTGRKP